MQWEFCYHAVNSFVKILDAMLTRVTCGLSLTQFDQAAKLFSRV